MASAALAVLFLAVPSRHRKKTSDSQRQEATKRWNRAALFLSSCVQLGMALGNHRASTRVVSDMFGAFEFTKWLCVCTRLLSERCHVLSQASSHIMHQPPLWECPYFFLHSQPQLSALKRTRVLGNEKCCVSLKKKNNHQQSTKTKWQPFFFLMTGRLPWEASSYCSRGNHMNRRALETHFIKLLRCKEHHYLFCSASDCMTGSWSVSYIEQVLQKKKCLSCFRHESSNHTP